jgi:UDP-N-acetylmuramoylalanine--D-glutamate ligase
LNLCAALTALDAVGIATPALPEALQRFTALPHRLEPVPRSGDADVLWVDDSISTTPESAIAAIQSFPDREVVLIGGGFDRGQDYTELGQLIGRRKAVVIGLPTTGERLVGSARAAGVPQDRAFTVEDLPAAVIAARELAEPGGAVLLSPAAPSYNTYTSHIERGKHFKQLVREHPPDQS